MKIFLKRIRSCWARWKLASQHRPSDQAAINVHLSESKLLLAEMEWDLQQTKSCLRGIASSPEFSVIGQRANTHSLEARTHGWDESDVEEIVELLERVDRDHAEAQRREAAAARFMHNWSWRALLRTSATSPAVLACTCLTCAFNLH